MLKDFKGKKTGSLTRYHGVVRAHDKTLMTNGRYDDLPMYESMTGWSKYAVGPCVDGLRKDYRGPQRAIVDRALEKFVGKPYDIFRECVMEAVPAHSKHLIEIEIEHVLCHEHLNRYRIRPYSEYVVVDGVLQKAEHVMPKPKQFFVVPVTLSKLYCYVNDVWWACDLAYGSTFQGKRSEWHDGVLESFPSYKKDCFGQVVCGVSWLAGGYARVQSHPYYRDLWPCRRRKANAGDMIVVDKYVSKNVGYELAWLELK